MRALQWRSETQPVHPSQVNDLIVNLNPHQIVMTGVYQAFNVSN